VSKYGDNILALQLDVNDRSADFASILKAKEHFGNIDVLINNAGYGLFGAIEETTEKEARDQMETNFFGLLWLSQAVLPIMREQGHGHIIQLSSVLGLISRPVLGLYAASKFAVEGLSESLAAEVKGFGIHVSIIEPAGFSDLSMSEIAYELGFEHSQSFSRLFKAKTQLSPLEFRQSFKNC
jgi:short-subunit dehydrogenase